MEEANSRPERRPFQRQNKISMLSSINRKMNRTGLQEETIANFRSRVCQKQKKERKKIRCQVQQDKRHKMRSRSKKMTESKIADRIKQHQIRSYMWR